MPIDLKTAHKDLWKWCRDQGFAGYDPYDALNSRLFQATPFKHSRAARLGWTQFHKRSPINFRSLVGIPRERNAKAIALFALAALADFRRHPTKENEGEARELLDDLIWMSLKGFHGACWGYNFDWQSRSFFAPRGTPTIVPTAFAARALSEAAEGFSRDDYLPLARTSCDFILNDLHRSNANSDQFGAALRDGYGFWSERFFLTNGWPKYFPDHLYPADIHSAASAIVSLVELRGRIPGTLILAERIADWTNQTLRDARGYFYYQRRRFYKVRIPYMRWSEGWMLYALARLREATE